MPTKKRASIPKLVAEKVLQEYRHLCAICGCPKPQLHHIDENPSNNDGLNLIPLCPNCHLQDVHDAHDPTRPPEKGKLRLFRLFKDPWILDARFEPIYRRLKFLRDLELKKRRPKLYEFKVDELLDFIGELEMGAFYQKKVKSLVKYPCNNHLVTLAEAQDKSATLDIFKGNPELVAEAINASLDAVEMLIVEQLRYQNWSKRKVEK